MDALKAIERSIVRQMILAIATVLLGIVTLGLWLVLVYIVLAQIGADATTWTIYWVYAALAALTSIVAGVAGHQKG